MSESSIRNTPLFSPLTSLHTSNHRLAGLISRLHRNQNAPARSEAMSEILDELSAYAFETLVREESMLSSMGINLTPKHSKEHVCFQEYVANHCLQATLGVNAPNELLDFLIDWWHNHVLGTDLNEIPPLISGVHHCRS
jgi:hemerythrin-like metal-binding protein